MIKRDINGFTLVELLAVIVVLGIILAIAVPAIGNTIESARVNAFNVTEGMVEDAARTYLVKNMDIMDRGVGVIPLVALEQGYITPVLGPRGEDCEGCVTVLEEDNEYSYKANLQCGNYGSEGVSFISVWKTDNLTHSVTNSTSIKIPLSSTGTYDFTVSWGDGITSEITTYNDVDIIHDYTVAGTYIVMIEGIIEGFGFGSSSSNDNDKIIDVKQWGEMKLHPGGFQFYYAAKLLGFTATDTPDLSEVTSFSSIFDSANKFNSDIGNWDTSNVTNMYQAFRSALAFNGDIGNWDTSKVTSMRTMFYGAANFNQDIGGWNTSKVTSLSNMFREANAFNQDINSWDVSKVTNTEYLFAGADDFNQSLDQWDVSSVTDMSRTFYNTGTFNGNIGSWDTSNVIQMDYMFEYAAAFNQDISEWNTSKVTISRNMFRNASLFNQDISGWDTSKITNMQDMFENDLAFEQNLSSWDVTSVTSMYDMFNFVTLSTVNYDALLISFAGQAVKSNVPFNGGLSKYSATGEVARNTLINTYGWTFIDGGHE